MNFAICTARRTNSKALPKLSKGAINPKLKQLFSSHLEETKGQVERLKKVFAELGEKPTGQRCNGMEGVIEVGVISLPFREAVSGEFHCRRRIYGTWLPSPMEI